MNQQLTEWLAPLADWLAGLGVPEEQKMMAALGLLFLGATFVVLILIVLLLRASRPQAETPAASEVSQAAPDVAVEPPEPASGEVETGAPAGQAEEAGAAAATGEAQAGQADIRLEPRPEPEPKPEPEPEPISLFERLRRGLSKTQAGLVGRIDGLLSGRSRIDDELIEELEEILITADLGMQTTQALIGAIQGRIGRDGDDAASVRQVLQQEMAARLAGVETPFRLELADGPAVVMVVGVNGVGKTTTIGKLAHLWASQGKKVVLGAGDTFRAAAADQLQVWAERAGVDLVRHAEGADPAAVAFDAARAAKARGADILLLDTAGRLHTKVNLMEELKKVRRVLEREIPGAPHETLLVLDATTGQNALVQARLFQEAVGVTGLALTKLDGTARGGIVVAIANDLKLPVRFVGIGEGIEDLRPFDPELFVRALFDMPE
ncbi:MAG: hypothetical protein Tsb0017_23090 [Geothermobacteraceae bacterium]